MTNNLEFENMESTFATEFSEEINVTEIDGVTTVPDKIVGDTKVVAQIDTRPILSVTMDNYGNAAAYVALEEYDEDFDIWATSQYRELWDKYDYPNLDLVNATNLTDSEKADICNNIGAASVEDLGTTDANVSSLIMDTTHLDSRISVIESNMGDIETALDSIIAEQESILAMQNALIGGESV